MAVPNINPLLTARFGVFRDGCSDHWALIWIVPTLGSCQRRMGHCQGVLSDRIIISANCRCWYSTGGATRRAHQFPLPECLGPEYWGEDGFWDAVLMAGLSLFITNVLR